MKRLIVCFVACVFVLGIVVAPNVLSEQPDANLKNEIISGTPTSLGVQPSGFESNLDELKAKVIHEGVGQGIITWGLDIPEANVRTGLIAPNVNIREEAQYAIWVKMLVNQTVFYWETRAEDFIPENTQTSAQKLARKVIKGLIDKQEADEVVHQYDDFGFKVGVLRYTRRDWNVADAWSEKKTNIRETWGMMPYVAFQRAEPTDINNQAKIRTYSIRHKKTGLYLFEPTAQGASRKNLVKGSHTSGEANEAWIMEYSGTGFIVRIKNLQSGGYLEADTNGQTVYVDDNALSRKKRPTRLGDIDLWQVVFLTTGDCAIVRGGLEQIVPMAINRGKIVLQATKSAPTPNEVWILKIVTKKPAQ